MLFLLLAEALLLVGIIWSSGAITEINAHEEVVVDRVMSDRSKALEERMRDIASEVDSFSEQAKTQAQALASSKNLDAAALVNNTELAQELLGELVDPMVETLAESGATGIYVVLNSDDLSAHASDGAYGEKQAVYIIDINPIASATLQSDDLVFACAPSAVVEKSGLATRFDWNTELSFEARTRPSEYDFFAVPFQAAYNNANKEGDVSSSKFGYWSVAMSPLGGSQQPNTAYSVPLMLEDGSVFGVAGIELSYDHLRHLLPYGELSESGQGFYMVALAPSGRMGMNKGEVTQLEPVMNTDMEPKEGLEYGSLFSVAKSDGGLSSFYSVDDQYFVSAKALNLHKSRPEVDPAQWMLLGILPKSELYSFGNTLRDRILVATLLMLILGVVGSYFVGKSVSRPIRRLSDELSLSDVEAGSQIQLSSTGITEVDKLTETISALSGKVAETNKLVQERLEIERDHDSLTGLLNRGAFVRTCGEIFKDPSKIKHAAVVMADLDDLKHYNDTYGHSYGDLYIRQAALSFTQGLPENAVLARVSGDEFFMLFYGYETQEQMEKDISQMWETFQQGTLDLPDGTSVKLSASGGVALYLKDSTEFSGLMDLADFTMYQVKKSGKNDIAYFDFDTYQEMMSIQRSKVAFAEIMNDYSLVSYHFQPIVDARTGTVFAYEALLRVQHGPIESPADILQLAEKEEQQHEVERLTWVRAFECFESFRQELDDAPAPHLFINSFGNLSLPAQELEQISAKHSDVMSGLVVEITELHNLNDEAMLVKRAIPGFSGMFALDDYGSGYHSDNILLRLHPRFIKIDMSVIRNIQLSSNKQILVSHAVEYARSNDMRVIAEGVETYDELNTLIELDIDYVQGYCLAKPSAEPAVLDEEAVRIITQR